MKAELHANELDKSDEHVADDFVSRCYTIFVLCVG